MNAASTRRPDVERIARAGARTYGRVLADAGGQALQTLNSARRHGSPLVVVYSSPPYELNVPSLPAARIAVNLTRSLVSGGIRGDRPRSFDARRHSIFLTPSAVPVAWRKESPSRHLLIYFDPHMLQGADDAQSRDRAVPTLFNAAVPGVNRLVDELVDEFVAPGLLTTEVADSLGRLVLVSVARHLWRVPARTQALTPGAFARLRDFVAANIAERLLVADLAREVGLSPDRFAFEFTQLVGQPPHRYLLSMRIERALLMLDTTTSSLAEIAHDCGFASQQHMNNAIARRVGMTPKRYRLRPGR